MSTDPTIAVIGTARNGWLHSFAHVSNRIAHALIDGRITVADIDALGTDPAAGYDEAATRALAEKADVPLGEDADAFSVEDVEISVDAITGLAGMRICAYDEPDADATWMFYAEDLAEQGTTIHEVRRSLQGIGLVDAAALIIAGDDWYRGKVRARREGTHA